MIGELLMSTKTEVICFVNNKGGSGKSTTCANIGYGLSTLGYKVLLIDGDMQLNLSLSFFSEEYVLERAASENNLFYAIKNTKDLSSYITPTPYDNLHMILSSTLMSSIEFELFTKWQREFILKNCLKTIYESGQYDYILIDSPPTLGGWVMNILSASTKLIIPVEASPWGLFGLANMFEFLENIKTLIPDLKLLGIAVTKVDERKGYFKQTMEVLKELQDTYVFNNYIKVDSSIEWSQENGKPVIAYKKSSRSSKEYMELAKEVDKLVCK
jgi:chromosome partitioning protein